MKQFSFEPLTSDESGKLKGGFSVVSLPYSAEHEEKDDNGNCYQWALMDTNGNCHGICLTCHETSTTTEDPT